MSYTNNLFAHASSGSPYHSSQYQRQGGIGGRRENHKTSPEVADIDEEDIDTRTSTNTHLNSNIPHTPSRNNMRQQFNTNHIPTQAHSAPVTPQSGRFLPPSHGPNGIERPSPSIALGGQNSKRLTRRVGTQSQAQFSNSSSPIVNDENDPSGRKKRKFVDQQKQEEEKEKEKEESFIDDDFDPMAPIHVFDSEAELENEWDKIQKDLVDFLNNFAKDTLSQAFENILQVNHLFTELNRKAQKELLDGVADIENEEAGHENARKIITDFSEEMKRAADLLSKFGGFSLLKDLSNKKQAPRATR
ncbi:uncharacterized protein L201_000177 [Kwoniella dendrophila CBS 6074]|uniref:Extracellular mutant protein 11 C-terminal domain-containing protein n=1 Tax=Kwoniella dendrophila CBS 6074 TaxID=1295534 RepID=A0AAX4JIQ9_9TREE